MPKMTGPDTSKAIRKLLRQGQRGPLVHRQERPIICGMTALSHQEVFSVASQTGMDQVFIKPVYEEDFRRTLSQVGIRAVRVALTEM